MNDTTEISPVDDVRARNKAIVFAALADAGIRKVTVEYDGSGNSGQIEDVAAWNAGNERGPLPADRKIQLVSENSDYPLPEQNFEAAVEHLCWDYLEIYTGWENNDGAFRHLRLRRSRPHGHARTQRALHRSQHHQPRILTEAAMAHPYHHSLASVKKWGGEVSDYIELHSWFDHSKSIAGDFRHRALRHHAEGIFMLETLYGQTF